MQYDVLQKLERGEKIEENSFTQDVSNEEKDLEKDMMFH